MRFEEAQQRAKEGGLGGSAAKLVSPDSGQVQETLRPALIPERCRKRRQGESDGVALVFAKQSLHHG